MTVFQFSTLADGQHLAFNLASDILNFGAGIDAATVRVVESGGNLALISGGRTVWLDGVLPVELALASITFANQSRMAFGDLSFNTRYDWYGRTLNFGASTVGNQINGLGGADSVLGGSGNDWIIGNIALSPLTHVSRVGLVGSPNAANNPSISADGRFVAFEGGWTGFGSQNNSATDVLVRDMVTGVVTNQHISSTGQFGGSGSGESMIAADGLSVVFTSSSNLVPGNPPSSTIYRATIAGNGIQAVSVTAGGVFANNFSHNADVSANGRFVTFSSAADNLAISGNVNFEDIYLKDMQTGALTRITTSLTGGDVNGVCTEPRISADGRFVVFSSEASNLTPTRTGGGNADIYI